MEKEFNPYLILQDLQQAICKHTDEDWFEIRKDPMVDIWYMYCIEDAVMQGCENNADLEFKFRIIDEIASGPDDDGNEITIPCYDRLLFHNINEDIELAEFYRQYKNNITYYNKHYSSRFKLPIMTVDSFKKLFPTMFNSNTSKKLLLLLE